EPPPLRSRMTIPEERRAAHLGWLKEVTAIPTAAGREGRVLAWIDRWLTDRDGVAVRRDAHGNVELRLAAAPGSDAPVYFTAHLDHPAFVVDEVLSPTALVLGFRGGVMADYFPGARVRVHA